jgi:hypothetical protein
MANYKIIFVALLASFVLGVGVAYKLLPPKVETKTEVQEREVTKNHIVTVVKEVTRPDGTKEKTSTTTDTSVEHKDRQITIEKAAVKDWFVTAGVAKESLTGPEIYQLSVNRRILGPIYLGASATTEKQIGINVGLEF